MARRITPAQARAAMKAAQRKQKQAIDNYNREARRHNNAVEKAVKDHNREARRHNNAVEKAVKDHNREVRAYNAKVRTHNARVENQRRRLNQEIRRLNSRPTSTTFVTYRSSVDVLTRSYALAEERLESGALTTAGREMIDLGSEDAANSVYLLNAMDGDGAEEEDPDEDALRSPSMQDELSKFGQDLVDRWTGALFSLSPNNPDAARHFCTSAREVLITMIDQSAPDDEVVANDPACDRTDRGVPTRRSKVSYLLRRKDIGESSIEDLVEKDMDNVLTLFRAFNDGTHGHAGRFTITQLNALRIRVESAIAFVHALCVP
jgi:flagellar biosynthesis GTPase FlhF